MASVYEIPFDYQPGLFHAVQALAYLAYPPRGPVRGGAALLVSLPRRVACLAGPAVFAGEAVARRVERCPHDLAGSAWPATP
jgi:hypothetical protein